MVYLAISDSGSGIETDEMQQMFQPFYTTKSQGIGLGLYICEKIMNDHGGGIEVKSDVGIGTTFLLRFSKGGDC